MFSTYIGLPSHTQNHHNFRYSHAQNYISNRVYGEGPKNGRNFFLFCDVAKSQNSFATTLFLRLETQNMIVKRNRLPIGYMSHNFRAYGLNVLEMKELDEIDTYLYAGLISAAILIAKEGRRRHKKYLKKVKKFCAVLAALRISKTTYFAPKVLGPPREKRTILSFSCGECWRRFRFRRRDLPRLLRVLGLENFEVQLGKHGTFSGEEILLYSLNRLTTCTSHADLSDTFNTDQANLSAMYNFFLSYVYDRFAYLLKDNLVYWSQHFPYFAECIRKKFNATSGLNIVPGNFKVVAFHDDTVLGCCRPGGGPAQRGVNAPRYNNFIQMAFIMVFIFICI